MNLFDMGIFIAGEVMETIDELRQVFCKYQHVVVDGQSVQQSQMPETSPSSGASLLDLSTSSGDGSVATITKELADISKQIVTTVFLAYVMRLFFYLLASFLGFGTTSIGTNKSTVGGYGDLLAFSEDASAAILGPPTLSVLQPVSLNPAPPAGNNYNTITTNCEISHV